MSRVVWASLLFSLGSGVFAQPNPDSQSFTAFESGQVRPLAITPDKKFLLAVNTPDAKLELFKIDGNGLELRASIPVGREPVSVAIRNNEEAWVVNHLSDSVSVVVLHDKNSYVKRTLPVGDEPRDIVFAGPGRNRAFITTAHRGQNSSIDPKLTTPALAVTPDASKVYAASFFSGNRTASTLVGTFPGLGTPLPPAQIFPTSPIPLGVNSFGEAQNLTSVIVKFDGTSWKDENGLNRDVEMMFTLPDRDVFAIDATANPPRAITGPAGVYSGVGTTLFNMIVNPANGKVHVSNLA